MGEVSIPHPKLLFELSTTIFHSLLAKECSNIKVLLNKLRPHQYVAGKLCNNAVDAKRKSARAE